MIFWSYLNMILTRHLHTCCDPDTKYPIRAKVCVWQGISSAGVAQSDGGVNGKRKGVGGLWDWKSLWSDETDQWAKDRLWWWERSADRQLGEASLVWRSVSWGVWSRVLWLTDGRTPLLCTRLSRWKRNAELVCPFECWNTFVRLPKSQWSAVFCRLCVITEQVGDLKDTRDSQFCQVYRERMGVCLAWQLHPINCTALSKLHSNHLAQTETKMHCSDGGRRRRRR